jgi:hypothetical protein
MTAEEGETDEVSKQFAHRSRVQSETHTARRNHARRLGDQRLSRNLAEKMRSRLSRGLERGVAPDGGVIEGFLDSVEYKQRRSVPGFVIPDRFEDGKIRPTAGRGRSPFLQHGSHCLADEAKLLRRRTDDLTGHERRRRLSEQAGFDRLSEIADPAVPKLEIDRHGRSAELRMTRGRSVGVGQSFGAGDRTGKLENARVVYLVEIGHGFFASYGLSDYEASGGPSSKRVGRRI